MIRYFRALGDCGNPGGRLAQRVVEGAGGREVFSVVAGEQLAERFPAMPDVYRTFMAEAAERLGANSRELPQAIIHVWSELLRMAFEGKRAPIELGVPWE